MANTNNVIGIIAKAIKKNHGDISGSISSLSTDYQLVCETFKLDEQEAEGLFTASYIALDADKEASESANLAAAMVVVQSIRDGAVGEIVSGTIDTLLEMESQISASYDEFVTVREAHSSSLASIRADIRTDWGLMSEYSSSYVSEYNSTTIISNKYYFEFDGQSNSAAVSSDGTYSELRDYITLSAWVRLDDDFLSQETGRPLSGTIRREYGIVDKAEKSFRRGYSLYMRKAATPNYNIVYLGFGAGRLWASDDAQDNKTLINNMSMSQLNAGIADRRVEFRVNTPSNPIFIAGQLHHVVATFDKHEADGNHAKLYVDGVAIASGSISGSGNIVRANEKFCIGNTTAQPGKYEFDGVIDEVSLWDVALDSSSIAELSNWTLNGNLNVYSSDNALTSNLLGWYRMGDPSDSFDPDFVHLDENGDPLVTSFNTDGSPASPGIAIPNGQWTLKSSTDLLDETKYLKTVGVSYADRKEQS